MSEWWLLALILFALVASGIAYWYFSRPSIPIAPQAWAGATPSICWPDRSYPVYAFVDGEWPHYGTGAPAANRKTGHKSGYPFRGFY